MADSAKWYVIHTFSGYEKKVETSIRQMIDNRGLHEQIIDMRIPEEDDTESSRQGAKRKIFPSYVFVKMIMTDDTWHLIRNIRGVTGFVGPGSKPEPLTEEEMLNINLESRVVSVEFEVGDTVRITDGPLNGYLGRVTELDAGKSKVRLMVDLFMGRETEVDLEVSQVDTLD